MEHYESRKTRASSRVAGPAIIKKSSYYLSSVAIGLKTYSGLAILALSTPDFATFILPSSDYIEIPMQYISEPVHPVQKRKRERNDTPCLVFKATGGVLLNGRQRLSEASVSIVSEQDLDELRNTLADARRKAQKQNRVTRRISSTIVALDTGEEVATKSSQCCDSSSQASNREINSSADKDHNHPGESRVDTSDSKQDELRAISDVTREPSGLEESSLMAIEDVEILAEALSESDQTPLVSPSQEHRYIDREKKVPFPCDAKVSPGEYVTSPITDDHSTSSLQIEAKPVENIMESDTANAISRNSQPKCSGMSKRRATQKKPPPRRSLRGRTLSKRKDRPALPNTQESLLFPRMGRPSKKIYTSRSKRAVDWEEDLRPTEDEQDTARAMRDGSQLTSVPSPSPGDTSIFSRKSNAAQKKRKAHAASSSSAKGRRSAKKRGAGINRRGMMTRLPLQTREPNINNGDEGASTGHEVKETTINLNGNTETENYAGHRPHNYEDKENTPGLTAKPDNCSAANVNQFPSRVQGSRSPLVDTQAQADAAKGTGQRKEGAGEGNPHMGLNEQPSTNKMTVSQKPLQQTKPMTNQNICVSQAHDEQALMEGLIPEQRLELPNEYRKQRGESDQLRGSGNFQALFVSQDSEIGRLSVSAKDCTHDTPVEVTTDENGDDSQTEPEELTPVRSRKRAATQNSKDEAPNKKPQLIFGATSDHQNLHLLEDAVQQDGTSRQSDIENASNASMGEISAFSATYPESKLMLERMEGNLSEQNTTPEGRSRLALPTSSQKKSIVDENGSPRLMPRQIGNDQYFQTKTIRRLRLEQWRDSLEDVTSRSGYHGDSDDDSLPTFDSASTHLSPRRDTGSFKGGRLNFRLSTILAGDVNEARPTSHSCAPDNNTRGQSTWNPDQLVESMITPYSVSELPAHRAEGVDTSLSSATTIRLPQEPTQLGIQVEEGPGKANWQASLEAIQKTTHDLLFHTSEVSETKHTDTLGIQYLTSWPIQRLTHQLEHEKGTIGQVLNSYQQSCHQVMDQLFQVYEERIEVYRQQMQSVRKQHGDLCQDLIRRFKENDRRIQERLCSSV